MSVGFDAIWEAAKKLDTDLSGVSWNGFNVAGDRKSIAEVRRLMDVESRLLWFERECERLRGIIMTIGRTGDGPCDGPCYWCGKYHDFPCPFIKAIEYHPDGHSVKRVEFLTPAARMRPAQTVEIEPGSRRLGKLPKAPKVYA